MLVSIAAVSIRRMRASVGEKVYFEQHDFEQREIKLMVLTSPSAIFRLQKCSREKG